MHCMKPKFSSFRQNLPFVFHTWALLFFLCWISGLQAADPSGKTICLNMIVKNEKDVIERCLRSVKPVIDYWVIVDTGSTDGTQEIIRNFMKGIPGDLYERPWVDFSHNRNQALQFAKGKADYILIIDADEVLSLEPDFKVPSLDQDFYHITTSYGGTKYHRVQLVNNHLNWEWIGVLHEHLESPQAKSVGLLEGVTNVVNTDGARSKDPHKYDKDAALLEKALEKDPDNTRYRFYLAQSYRDAQKPEKAIENYQKRIEMGGWDQEVFWSMLQIAILQEILEKPSQVVVEAYHKAYKFRPTRAEPLYRLANYYRRKGDYHAGYITARKGIEISESKDALFVEQWIYDHGMMLEYAICAYWTEKYAEAQLASLVLLARPSSPDYIQTCAKQNLTWITKKLADSMLDPQFDNPFLIK